MRFLRVIQAARERGERVAVRRVPSLQLTMHALAEVRRWSSANASGDGPHLGTSLLGNVIETVLLLEPGAARYVAFGARRPASSSDGPRRHRSRRTDPGFAESEAR